MSSYKGTCEIIESKDELGSFQNSSRFRPTRMQDRMPPLLKKGTNRTLENDINKLFEAIDLKTSKSLDFSDRGFSSRNASKRPMRAGGSQSPGIGFSDPVSLKQALRGLSISHAAETAAMKRLPKLPGSPSISEAGMLSSSYRSVEIGDSSFPLSEGRGRRVQASLMPGESSSSFKMPQYILDSKSKSANHSVQSSPLFVVKPSIMIEECTPQYTEDVQMPSHIETKTFLPKEGSLTSDPSSSCEPTVKSGNYSASSSCTIAAPRLHEQKNNGFESTFATDKILPASVPAEIQSESLQKWEGNQDAVPSKPLGDTKIVLSVKKNGTKNPSRIVGISVREATKSAPKIRRKGRLQTLQSSSATKGNKGGKLVKSAPAAGKTPKNVIKKKERSESLSNDVQSASQAVSDVGLTTQLICQRCRCHLKPPNSDSHDNDRSPIPADTPEEVSPLRQKNGVSKSVLISNGCNGATTPSVKPIKMLNSREQGEFSQSSKSSIGEHSSSTNISDESNLSALSSRNRPHMSEDFRWEAINNVKKQHGFLGLGHFNLLKKLGSGDIGTVYLAELIGTSCLFAIKVMDNEFLVRRRKMSRAQTEREILRMLDHPFLPTLFAQFTSDNLSCLVMEFCPGGDLHVLRQQQPGRYYPEQAARFYVAEVLLALEYLHMLGIVYRDLKPENIMVREDGHIMLTDFDLSLRCSVNPILVKSPLVLEPARISGPCAGSSCIDPFCTGPSCKVSCFTPRLFPSAALARKQKAELAAQNRSLPQLVAEPTEARSNSFVGTHEYLAPEIIKGEGHGSAVDWWTLGVFLYELLYGKTPFKGSGNEETLANVVLQSLRFPDSPMVSIQARDLIRGLLVKEPENRLGMETGAAEIKRHSFFDGLNWALIRCAVPPQVPEFSDEGVPKMDHPSKESKFLESSTSIGEHLEFELF
ncbi:hypothetical protein Leryth_016395 [Lithospermum erythrorhizon]|nr:hypothetical protein Leryth_016395 [Lithospermum erythrorhizon]